MQSKRQVTPNYHNVRDEKGHFIPAQSTHAFAKTVLTASQTTKAVEKLLRDALGHLSCTAFKGETMPELVTARRNLKNAMRLFTWWTAWNGGYYCHAGQVHAHS